MLPTKKTKPVADLAEQTFLVHGNAKEGKLTFASGFNGAIFFATEPGLNNLEVFQTPVTTWDEMLEASAEIAAGKHNFKTVVVDTIDNAYLQCSRWVCKKNGFEHESDFGFGKGWAIVNREFHRWLTKMAALPYGLVLISHSQDIEVETAIGKRTKTMPTLAKKGREVVIGFVDIILYAHTIVEKNGGDQPRLRRVMHTKPNPAYEAGDRTGRLPEMIDLNYAAFEAAYVAGVATQKPATKSQKGEAA